MSENADLKQIIPIFADIGRPFGRNKGVFFIASRSIKSTCSAVFHNILISVSMAFEEASFFKTCTQEFEINQEQDMGRLLFI